VNASQYNAGVGRKLRASRRAHGLTQADVAALVGVSPMSISNWEAGRCSLTAFMRSCLSEIYSKPTTEIKAQLEGKASA
jgi:transcriptional regulator with XRE-family HTH domain